MKPSFWFAAVVLAAGSTWAAGARADSADARCEVRRNGETKAAARTENGRYQSIVQAPPFDCGH